MLYFYVFFFVINTPLIFTRHSQLLYLTGIFKVAISLLGAMEAQFMALEDLEGFAMLMREWKKLGEWDVM